MKRIQPSKRALRQFEYFAACLDVRRMPEIPLVPDGYSAAECFHVHETHGAMLPCRDPERLARALNGKAWHGVTVKHCAEDYVGRILCAADLRDGYPDNVRREILQQAAKLAVEQMGYVPTFIRTGEDYSTLDLPRMEQ